MSLIDSRSAFYSFPHSVISLLVQGRIREPELRINKINAEINLLEVTQNEKTEFSVFFSGAMYLSR